jgi:hypothetical protein
MEQLCSRGDVNLRMVLDSPDRQVSNPDNGVWAAVGGGKGDEIRG